MGTIRLAAALMLLLAMSGCALLGQKREPAPPPAAPSYYIHKVRFGGETLALIAYWYTGKSKNWERILNENRGLQPGKIRIGTEIRIPYDMIRREAPLTESAVKAANKTQPQEEKSEIAAAASNDIRQVRSVQIPVSPLSEEVRRESKTTFEESDSKIDRAIQYQEKVSTPEPGIQTETPADHPGPAPTPEFRKSEPASKPETLMTREELLKELLKD